MPLKTTLIAIAVLIHIIGAVVTIIVYHKNGTMKFAAEHGDGFRLARPADVIVQTFIAWEIYLLLNIIEAIETKVNQCVKTKYDKQRGQ